MEHERFIKLLMDYFGKSDLKNRNYNYSFGSPFFTVYYSTTLDDDTTETAEYLEKLLESAIKNENYELAIKIRDRLAKLNNPEIDSLRAELDSAVKEQNFERAIELRDEISKLTNKAHK